MIRKIEEKDIPVILNWYNWYIRNSTATFETEELTLDELKQRAKHFLDWIKSEYPDKVILAVGHGIINKAIQSVFYDKPMNEIAVMKNADIRILQLI